MPRVAGNPREEIAWFADQMELKARENDHKRHWNELSDNYILNRIYQEYYELVDASETGKSPEEIIKEAADVALLCNFIADNARRRLNGC